jgi:hypothetical protein
MGIQEARKYLNELKQKQGKPELWPDFLTGLPDKSTMLKKVGEAIMKRTKHTVFYIRIADVEPYLVKYGSTHHIEVVKWAAAILKTTAEKYHGVVGVFDTHDFIAILKKKDAGTFIGEAKQTFDRKVKSFYSDEDLKSKTVLSFKGNGGDVNVGLMRLASASSDDIAPTTPEKLISALVRAAKKAEKGN